MAPHNEPVFTRRCFLPFLLVCSSVHAAQAQLEAEFCCRMLTPLFHIAIGMGKVVAVAGGRRESTPA